MRQNFYAAIFLTCDGKKTKFFCQLDECIEKKPSQWFSDYKHFWKHHYEVHAPQAQSMYKCLQCPNLDQPYRHLFGEI